MVEPTPSAELDALIAAARRAEPDELTPLQARRLVRSALAEDVRRSRAKLRAWSAIAAAVACAAALGFAWLSPRNTAIELAGDALPLRLSLKSGDSLVIAAGTRLSVIDDAAPRRAIELERGTVLFDVQRLGRGQSFEVQTRDARVRVLGTVFSVAVEAGQTRVHVHEGKVSVAGRTLRANQAWASSGTIASPQIPFASEARAFVLARTSRLARSPSAVVSPLPVPAEDPSARASMESASPALVDDTSAPPTGRSDPSLPDGAARTAAPRTAGSAAATELAEDAALDWLALGRRELARGQAERALAVAHAHGDSLAALRLAADALRALGRFEEALVQYELVALRGSGELRVQAGYGAAQLALGSLSDPARALALIARFELDAKGSALRERASLLRIESLLALGRKSEALSVARGYLEREPATATSERLRTLFEGAL